MVAEPFIFLSSDRQVDVRCCLAKGTPLFCVMDFIRRTANRRMGPADAMQYWMHISVALQTEYDIVNAFVYKFPGPYEKPNVCVNANGLLVLYHHMDLMHGLVNERYRVEVNERLQQVLSGQGGCYIEEEHDDGEVDEQLAEEGGQGLTEPPERSRFWYVPVLTSGVDTMPIQEALLMEKGEKDGLAEKLAHEKRENDGLREMNKLLKKRVDGFEAATANERCKKDAFTLRQFVRSIGLMIPEGSVSKLFKRTATCFRRMHPGVKLTRRQHVTYFPSATTDSVECILRREFLQMERERSDREHLII